MTRLRWMTGPILLLAFTGALLATLPRLSVWHATLSITAIHILLSAVLLVVAGPLLFQHLRKKGRWRAGGAIGWAAMALLLMLIISGGSLVIQGQRGQLALVHTVAGLGFLAGFFAHGGLALIKPFFHSSLRLVIASIFAALIIGAMVSARPTHSTASPEEKQFPPAAMRILGEISAYDEETMGPSRCAACHAQIVDQWKQSLHAVADTELLYARVVGEFRKEHGFEASNWCAGCHSPLRLGRGELNEKVAIVAQPNVDCIVCHSIRTGHVPIGNNGYDMVIGRPSGYELGKSKCLSDRLLLVQPAAHRSMWNGDFMRSPEFCGVCHRQVLPDSLSSGHGGAVLQDTYEEWATSKYNTADQTVRRTCQDCHMPRAPGLAADLGRKRPSHLFLGGSLDIARIMGAHSSYAEGKPFLEKAATIAITSSRRDKAGVELMVKVTNSGAGHKLPTGVSDLREVWVAVTVTSDTDEIVYESGKLDADGFLDPSAVTFGMTLGDGNGNPVRFHHIAKAREILSDSSIPAGETREIKYRVPPLTSKRIVAEAKLMYRAVPQDFINHYMTPDLRSEAVVMSKASATIDVSQ